MYIRKKIYLITLFLFGAICNQQAVAQQSLAEKYGVNTISSMAAYKALVKKDPSKALVALDDFIPGITLDIRYATANNLMERPMYTMAAAYLSKPAAKALKAVQQDLNKHGYGLKVYDGYRPYRVTVDFYEAKRDTAFVASPYTGSRHNRGSAVDLTIIDLKTGEELEMPTPYDAFTDQAHITYSNLPATIIKNRELLKKTMEKHGFQVYPNEWWHYDFIGWKEHPLMDIPFEELEGKLSR